MLRALEDATEQGIISESDVTQEKLEGFLSRFGRRFYKLPDNSNGPKIVLERQGGVIPASIKSTNVEVGLSRAGDQVFTLSWKA